MNFYTILQTRVGLLVSVYIEGGVGIFGFAVLVIFLIASSVVFRFWCLLRFAGFPLISVRFSSNILARVQNKISFLA